MPDDTPENEATPKPAPTAAPPAPAQPAQPQGVVINTAKMYGLGKDLLTLCVIPLLLWGVKLEVSNAQRDLQIEHLETEIERLERRVEDAEDIDKGVQANALKLATLEGKLDTANGRLHEITTLLRDLREP